MKHPASEASLQKGKLNKCIWREDVKRFTATRRNGETVNLHLHCGHNFLQLIPSYFPYYNTFLFYLNSLEWVSMIL